MAGQGSADEARPTNELTRAGLWVGARAPPPPTTVLPVGAPHTYFEEHVFLTGRQVHPILVVIHTQIHDVSKKLFVARNHFQLLLQRLKQSGRCMPLSTGAPGLQLAARAARCEAYLCDLVVVGQKHGQIL